MPRQSCILCHSVPSDILTLQCDHNLCIICASRVCSKISLTIICPFCKFTTYLHQDIVDQLSGIEYDDNQSKASIKSEQQYVSELINKQEQSFDNRYAKKQPKNKNKQNDYAFNQTSNKNKKNYIRSQINQTNNRLINRQNTMESKQVQKKILNTENQTKNSIQLTDIYCKQHNQYQIMYVCLDCDNCFICPQCVIHGLHKNHQVETIKKTISKIHAQVSSKIYSLDCSIQGLIKASQEKKTILKIKIQQINKLKQQAISKYKHMRQELAKQQKQIINKCMQLVGSFQRDYSQIQQWIKNDLILIEKQKNNLNSILNPMNDIKNTTKIKKINKQINKTIQIKIVQQYLNHLKRNDKNKNKKFMWINNKSNEKQLHQEIQQNLQVLTDRIQRIKPFSLSQIASMNNIETRQHSLAASRQKQNNFNNSINRSSNKQTNQSKAAYIQSPFNNLKVTFDKQSVISETSSHIINAGSRRRDSRMLKKSSLICEEQNNFLIF